MNLQPVDMRTKTAKSAQLFMARKGYREIKPLGQVAIDSDTCTYMYYQLPEGLLELEVIDNGSDITRKVSAFVIDRNEETRELLAS